MNLTRPGMARLGLLVTCLCGAGCGWVSTFFDPVESTPLNACAHIGESPSSTTTGEGKEPETAPLLSNFLKKGNELRDAGLDAALMGQEVEADLQGAIFCYNRAIQISPDSYPVNFGLGVAYLGLVKNAAADDERRSSRLAAAKRFLGRAYMLRQGHYEPLYYLAEVAVLENDYSRARSYLESLQKANMKPGPVAALLGYIAEQEGNLIAAAAMYKIAIDAGWPSETLGYVAERLRRKH